MNARDFKPAETIGEASAALNPEIPLSWDDPRFQDLSLGREAENQKEIARLLTRNQAGTFRFLAFLSHRGAGKSTELKRLANNLKNRYEILFIEANTEMNATQVEVEDLCWTLAQKVGELFDDHLSKDLKERINHWFTDVIKTTEIGRTIQGELATEAEAKTGLFSFFKFSARIKGILKNDSKHKTEIKEFLRKSPNALIDALNQLLDAAGALLERENKALLIIIDNLDRYKPGTVDRLITDGADRIKQLHTNLILTPPISLDYRPETEALEANYKVIRMPTIKLRERGEPHHRVHGPGKEVLMNALGKRVVLDKIIPDEAAREKLIYASGGSVRDLLELAENASLKSDDFITLDHVEKAIRSKAQTLRDRMRVGGLTEALAFIAENKALCEGQECLDALYMRLAFRYNGEGWYDIHPLLRDLEPFNRSDLSP